MSNDQTSQVSYPIILHPERIGYSVEIPDINGGTWTQGDTKAEALAMARDLIITMLTGELQYPSPTQLERLKFSPAAGDIPKLVSVMLDRH